MLVIPQRRVGIERFGIVVCFLIAGAVVRGARVGSRRFLGTQTTDSL
jgi:hypothetical protein